MTSFTTFVRKINFNLLSFNYLFYFTIFIFSHCQSYAHNGAIAHAYPIDNIKIDGDLSDWATSGTKYPLQEFFSDAKPTSTTDFSAFYQIGYNLKNQSLYIALEVTDDSYIIDTTKNVEWNTQDGVEFYMDAKHLPQGSGVAGYLFTKTRKYINKSIWDPITKNANWDNIEMVMNRKGNKTIYEWRILLGDQMNMGKSLGFDIQVFDKDIDDSFTITAWGKEGYKFRNPNSLGDIILMKANEKLGTISGKVSWDKEMKEKMPNQIRFSSTQSAALWVETEVDSLGNYMVQLPAGTYQVALPDEFIHSDKAIYQTVVKNPIQITVKVGQKAEAPIYVISSKLVPDLIPTKGILHTFDVSKAKEVDYFMETYRKYYQVAGVSLALIKDGKVAYHKTYGVKNTMTQAPVDENTLFEAASVTKPVFAYAVLRLMEKGLIELDKPLHEYLPFPDMEHDERYKLITARHVLTHRTGFPNWRYMNPDGKLDIKFTPGTSYGYSGEGFEYLKKVVEKITSKRVEQVLQEEVISPLGLYHTYFSKNDTLVKLVADGHVDNMPTGDGLPEQPGMAYSMHTEAKVFTKFMLNLLEQKGLSTATYEDMLRLHSEFIYDKPEDKPNYKEYMGLSLAIRESPHGKVFGHGGNNGDFRCEFEVYKDLKMGYVIFTNSSTAYPFIDAMSNFLVEGKAEK